MRIVLIRYTIHYAPIASAKAIPVVFGFVLHTRIVPFHSKAKEHQQIEEVISQAAINHANLAFSTHQI